MVEVVVLADRRQRRVVDASREPLEGATVARFVLDEVTVPLGRFAGDVLKGPPRDRVVVGEQPLVFGVLPRCEVLAVVEGAVRVRGVPRARLGE